MKRSEDPIVLDRLLSAILARLDEAIDFWTIVIVSGFPDPRAFVLKQGEIMRSLVVVTRTILAECQRADVEPERSLLDRMAAACQKLQDAFLILEQFRTLPLEEIRPATVTVGEVYHDLRDAIHQLGQTLALSIAYWQSRSPETEAYCQRILANLFEEFRYERETGAAAAARHVFPRSQAQ